MVQATGLPLPLARVLAARDVPAAGAEAFLAPPLRDLLPDPLRLKDMGAAAARFLDAAAPPPAHRGLRRLRCRRRRLGGAAADLAPGDGPERHALYPRPHRRGLWPQRAGDGGAGAGPRPDPLRRLRHAQPRAGGGGEGRRCGDPRPPSGGRDPAAGAGGGEPEPAGRGWHARPSLRRRGGVPDAGRGQPPAARRRRRRAPT